MQLLHFLSIAMVAVACADASPPPLKPTTPNPYKGQKPQVWGKGEFDVNIGEELAVRTPIHLYAEYKGPVKVSKVTLGYKAYGMPDFVYVDMKQMGQGFGTTIKCTEVTTAGELSYFLKALDDDDNLVGKAGGKNNPLHVSVKPGVQTIPFFPDRAPPKACKDTSDCPPGVVGETCRGG